jgi:hypothetical protein
MFLLERGKFMQPKYTSCFTDLLQELQIDFNFDSMSECSSISNFTFRKGEEEEELQSRNALVLKVS